MYRPGPLPPTQSFLYLVRRLLQLTREQGTGNGFTRLRVPHLCSVPSLFFSFLRDRPDEHHRE